MDKTRQTGWQAIEAERARQLAAKDAGGEGLTLAADDLRWVRELVAAAKAYADAVGPGAELPHAWPLGPERWKPRDRVSNLVRGGALYLAAADAQGRRHGLGTGYEELLRDMALKCGELIDELIFQEG